MGPLDRHTEPESEDNVQRSQTLEVPRTDAAIILTVTAVLVTLIILFLFQTPGLGLGISGE
jgi:hypothetical protein